jgi:hypothetical protein
MGVGIGNGQDDVMAIWSWSEKVERQHRAGGKSKRDIKVRV